MKYIIKFSFVFLILCFFHCRERGEIRNEIETSSNRLAFSNEYEHINYLVYTEDFIDQTWDRHKLRVRNNSAIDPNGNLTADLVDFSEDSMTSRLSQTVYNLKEGFYAFSIYLRAIEGQGGQFTISINSLGNKKEWRNTSIMINDKEWKRVDVRVKLDTLANIIVYPSNNLVKGTKENLKQVYMWGAQLEKIDYRDSPIHPYKGINIIK